MTIGEIIRIMRVDSGMTQEELAAKSGLNRNSIYRYEKGEVMPRMPQLTKIAGVFGMTVDEFMKFGDKANQFLGLPPDDLLQKVINLIEEETSMKPKAYGGGTAIDHTTGKIIETEASVAGLTPMFYKFAKDAQGLGLNQEDIDLILKMYERHQERNKDE